MRSILGTVNLPYFTGSRAVARIKPVVVVKSGRHAQGVIRA
jgi:acyl-CoA synthetase (NDP forming)